MPNSQQSPNGGLLADSTTISIADVQANEGEAGTTVYTFTVELSQPAGPGGVVFDIATADYTAQSASDYVARSLTGQVIPAGSTTYTFDVSVHGDQTIEPNEAFLVNLTNVVGASVADGQAQGTILSDDQNPGVQIAFTAYESDSSTANGKYFEFVLLTDVTAGTSIYFTDNGYRTDTGTFRTVEEFLRWTAQTDLPAGTRVAFLLESDGANAATAEWTNVTYFGTDSTVAAINLSTSGDQIHAFVDPVFGTVDSVGGQPIASIDASSGYVSTYTDTGSVNQTGLPGGLVVGETAIAAGNFDNARYAGPLTGTAEEIRAAINNVANWVTSNNSMNTPAFTHRLAGDVADYVENAAPVSIDVGQDALLFDDSFNMNNGSLTISITSHVAAEDQLGIAVGGSVSISAGVLSVNGTAIGTVTGGGAGGGDLVITFASSGVTAAAVQELLRHITYVNSSDNPTETQRGITITLTDGDFANNNGADTMIVTTRVNVSQVNDAPQGADETVVLAEDGSHVFSAADFNFSDTDGDQLTGVIIVVPPSNGTLSLNGVPVTGVNNFVSLADIAAGNLVYVPDANENGLGHDFLTFKVSDDGGIAAGGVDTDPNADTVSFDVTAVNDAPTLAGSAAGAFSLTEASNAANSGETARVTLFANVDIVDVDGGMMASAVVRIGPGFTREESSTATGYGATVDYLRINGATSGTIAGSGINYTYDPANGTMTLSGAATLAQYEEALQLVQFSTSGDNVTADGASPSRTIYASVSDGVALSGEISATVAVTGINDRPLNTGSPPTGPGFVEEATNIPLTGFSIGDADGDQSSQNVRVTFQITHGTISIRTDVPDGISGAMITGGANGSDTIIVTATQDQINATLANASGLTFTPPAGFNGNASFAMTTNDLGSSGNDAGLTGNGTSEQDADGWVIHILSVNDAPAGADAAIVVSEDDPYTFGAGDFGFADTDGNAFAGVVVTTLASNGTLVLNNVAISAGTFVTAAQIAGGALQFRPDANEYGSPYGSFTFQVRDNGGTANGGVNTDQTANSITVHVTADPIEGGSGGDTLNGTPSDDAINGYGGDDTINGGAGDDTLNGGEGVDTASYATATSGVTVSLADTGAQDTGGAGTDTLSEIENLTGSEFGDDLTGDDGDNQLTGLDGDDDLAGGSGNDLLEGGDGEDLLNGGAGNDDMNGGAGNDRFLVDAIGDVVAEGEGQGDDLVLTSVSYTLAEGVHVETLTTTNAASTAPLALTGNEQAQSIYGNAGNNVLTGGGGADFLVGGLGDDHYYVDTSDYIREEIGGGDDWIFVATSYTLREGNEIETLVAVNQDSLDPVNFSGNEFGQSLYGSQGANQLHGGGGDDYLVGLGGNDFLIGGEGNDHLAGGTGNDLYYADGGDLITEVADEGDDLVVALESLALGAGQSVETLAAAEGTAAIDITGNELAQSIYGNDGANVLTSGGGDDYLVGGGGNDTFVLSNASGIATIGDYATSETVDITHLLSVANGTDVVGGGYLRVTSGGQLQLDVNGGGDSWTSIANVSGGSAVTLRYLAGGSASDVTVARSDQAQVMDQLATTKLASGSNEWLGLDPAMPLGADLARSELPLDLGPLAPQLDAPWMV